MNKVLIPIIIGIGLSVPFAVGHLYFFDTSDNIDIDPEILEFYGEFVLQSDAVVYWVDLVHDYHPYIVLAFDGILGGYVVMDDPLPLFQELFPDDNVTTLVVLAGEKEIPYDTKNNLLRFNFNNTKIVSIGGE